MERREFELAHEFCQLVKASDLLDYLKLPPDTSADDAKQALQRQRKKMQSMQHNPKYKDAAKFLIKHYRLFESMLADPDEYLDEVRGAKESERLPILEIAIDSVLADGVLTVEELEFVRASALELGISTATYRSVLEERARERNVPMPMMAPAPPPVASLSPAARQLQVPEAQLDTGRTLKSTSGHGWWDAGFTRVLVDAVPHDAERMVDIACGLGQAPIAILPHRPQLEYLGIDSDERRVAIARKTLDGTPVGPRAVLYHADATSLGIPDDTVDLVLCVMSLQHFGDTRPVFTEAARILRPGGRFVAVEPDCLGQQFYFDRNLLAFNEAFGELCARVDDAIGGDGPPLGRPGIALGPQLGRRMAGADLTTVETQVYPVQVVHHGPFPQFARRLRSRNASMAQSSGLDTDAEEVRNVEECIQRLERQTDPSQPGLGVHILPLFVVVGMKT